MPIAYVFFLPVEEKKWRKRNQSRVKEKLTTFFTKNRIPKRMSRKRVAHSDNIIVSLFTMSCCKRKRVAHSDIMDSLLTMGCCKVFVLSTFENSSLTMKNSYHKVPSRRVNYYKHFKFDLRYNITSRDVTKKVRTCLLNSKDQIFGY